MWWTAIVNDGENYSALEFLDGPEPETAFENVKKVTLPDGSTIVALLKGQMNANCWGTEAGKLTSPVPPVKKRNSLRKRPPC
jgi:hypothetical protein